MKKASKFVPSKLRRASETYGQKLLRPEWQHRKKAYLNEVGVWCRSCRATDTVIAVHHLNYRPNRQPWEYKNDELIAFCSDCHTAMHKNIDFFRGQIVSSVPAQDLALLLVTLKDALRLKSPMEITRRIASV